MRDEDMANLKLNSRVQARQNRTDAAMAAADRNKEEAREAAPYRDDTVGGREFDRAKGARRAAASRVRRLVSR